MRSLSIKNYALIQELEIDFDKGLSILTGETGAGKSIILGALSLILGKRADTSALMDSTKKCFIEASFDVSNYDLNLLFERLDIDYEPITIVRREISATGKSRAFINDTPVNLQGLKELVSQLIDIHEQHQTLALNAQEYQLQLIDLYAGNTELLEDYSRSFLELKEMKRRLFELEQSANKSQEEQDYLTHQLEELQQAALKPGEDEELERELKALNHMEEVKSLLQHSIAGIDGEDQSAIAVIQQADNSLNRAAAFVDELGPIGDRLRSLLIELQDINSELHDVQQSLVFDPERLQIVQDRLNSIHTLQFKHNVNSVEELIDVQQKLDNQLGGSFDLSLQIQRLNTEIKPLEERLEREAEQISEKRQLAIPEFEKEVLMLLNQLHMKDAVFVIYREQLSSLSEIGKDILNFQFSANKGIPPSEISKVASGGELSRLMLSIKSVVSRKTSLPTIVFDEIDTGISGEVADRTGEIIKKLSIQTQILCITHLPQMASKGRQHYLVFKNKTTNPPKTEIRKLSEEERINEIAKMLSGEELTDQAIANAKVLLSD